jgi:hypothetical protein
MKDADRAALSLLERFPFAVRHILGEAKCYYHRHL